MPISQTTITGSVKKPDGSDAQLVGVKFALKSTDYEAGEVIAKNTVEAVIDSTSGDFTAQVWPNDRGLLGNTKYSVSYEFSDGSQIGSSDVYIRHSDSPKTIESVAFETVAAGQVAPMNLRVLSQAQFAALSSLDVNTAYLVTA